jgi:hypothetical protein
MWFLPILVFGAIAVAVARHSSRDAAPPSRQLPAPRAVGPFPSEPLPLPPSPLPPGVPGPIAVLGEIIKVGRTPPPTVVLCAIAEAQSIGRDDLVSDIVNAFVAPVVERRRRQRMQARAPRSAHDHERGSCAAVRSPREMADATTYQPARACLVVPPPDSVLRRHDAAPPTPSQKPPVSQAAAAPAEASPSPAPASPTPQGPHTTVTDNDIMALLDSDPARFMDLVSRSGGTLPPSVTVGSVVPSTIPASPVMVAPPIVESAPLPTGLPPETVARMQEAAGLAQAADRTRAMAPGSPIPGIADHAWRDFVVRLERESPQFVSSRHVGQYRQRRERLAELGINPAVIQNSAEAQRQALDADLADAHRHGVASELFAQHLGRPILLPGDDGSKTITLSGVLGVIQCAGLDGAAGWLERPNDRRRYPHTTQAFLHTNGVF